jgi:hypothetical protein
MHLQPGQEQPHMPLRLPVHRLRLHEHGERHLALQELTLRHVQTLHGRGLQQLHMRVSASLHGLPVRRSSPHLSELAVSRGRSVRRGPNNGRVRLQLPERRDRQSVRVTRGHMRQSAVSQQRHVLTARC